MSITLTEMLTRSRDMDAHKTDFTAEYKPGFSPDGKMFMGKGDLEVGPFAMTDHALGQLCSKLGRGTFGSENNKSLPRDAFKAWLADEDYAPHAAGILNDHIERLDPKLFVRTYEDKARAVLSSRYAVVQNTEILEKVSDALRLLGEAASHEVVPQVFRSDVTPDNMFLRFRLIGTEVLPPGESHPYGFGLLASNDELGRGRIKILPGLWRGQCDNTAYFDSEDLSLDVRHLGDQTLLAERVARVIAHGLKLSEELLVKFLRTKNIPLPNIFETITKMAEAEKWSVPMADAVREGTEGQHSLFGLIDGLTFAAQHVYAENQEMMTALEVRAGEMIENPTRWAYTTVTAPSVGVNEL